MTFVIILMLPIPPALAGACEVRNITIEGTSLEPRISDGETITVEIGRECRFNPGRGDVVLIASSMYRMPLAKVVAAAPGDRWQVYPDGRIRVNASLARNSEGQAYQLNNRSVLLLNLYAKDYGTRIPDEAYLVLGERVTGSIDSSRLGLVHRRDIIGRRVSASENEDKK